MAIKPIKGFYVHDEETGQDGIAKVSVDGVHEFVEDVTDAVDNWLDEHPEATTTVQDGSITESKIDGELVAKFKKSGVTVTKHIYNSGRNKTAYWITKIPYLDPTGNRNELKQYIVGQVGSSITPSAETVLDFYKKNDNIEVAFNSATFSVNEDTYYLPGAKYVIQNGVSLSGTLATRAQLICIYNDGTLGTVHAENMTAQQLINNGVKYCCTAFFTLLENGVVSDEVNNTDDWWGKPYQRQVIGQDADKNIYVLTTNGKNIYPSQLSYGITGTQCIEIMQSLNCTYAYMLDGGGSTCTVVDGVVLNQVTDEDATSQRAVPFIWYVEKEKDENVKALTNLIGDSIETIKDNISRTNKQITALPNTSNVTETAEAQEVGTIEYYRVVGSDYTGTDLPSNRYKWSIARIAKPLASLIYVDLFPSEPPAEDVRKTYTSNGWTSWFSTSKSPTISFSSNVAGELTSGSTYQLTATDMACTALLLSFRRWGRNSTIFVPISQISESAATSLQAISKVGETMGYADISINSTGLLTVSSITNWAGLYLDILRITI